MQANISFIPYQDTGKFSSLIIDYLSNKNTLQPYYNYAPNLNGIEQSIKNRKKFPFYRDVLVSTIWSQYRNIKISGYTHQQIESLANENTFTICTAHQPHLFAGHLYTIYKTMHAIQLAEELNQQYKGRYHFVPVYYIGSEDADKEELLHLYCNAKKITYTTHEKGAVGRMKAHNLDIIFNEIKTVLKHTPFINEMLDILKTCYAPDVTLSEGIRNLLHHFFADKGLIILDGDDKNLKTCFIDIFKKELFENFSHKLLKETIPFFEQHYFIPTEGRSINLFYIDNNIRERIISQDNVNFYIGRANALQRIDIENLLKNHPEKLSSNVILRPVYQETILPNIAFIGGSGEVAYWLLLKNIFNASNTHYPVIFLRNSLMLVKQNQKNILNIFSSNEKDYFKGYDFLLNQYIMKQTIRPNIEQETVHLKNVYQTLQVKHENLKPFIVQIEKKTLKDISKLNNKLLQNERKKYKNIDLENTLKDLFPYNNLQERIDSMVEWYAEYGKEIIDIWFENISPLKNEFGILYLKQ